MNHDVVGLLQALIRNQCVNFGEGKGGDEYKSVATLQEFFDSQGEIFEPAPGRQTLIYRIPGTEPEAPSLALVPHLDVVPVDPDGWTVDPFKAEIIDGFVYGRGAVDMFNVAAAMAVAAHPYVTGEIQPRGDLLFVATADEENGGVYGAKPLVERRWDLVHADYLLTEVGYPQPANVAGRVVPVAVGEKGGFWTGLKAGGTPGHGSAPYGADNAIRKMAAAVHGIFETPMPVEITEEWKRFVEALDLDPDLKEALQDPDRVDAAIDEIAVTDPLFARYAHAVTHLTVSPNMIEAGLKANIVADKAYTTVDIRALPGQDKAFVDSYLFKAMGGARDDIDIVPILEMEATISTVGNPLWEAIADAVDDLEGHRNLLPTLMNVATDARFWRANGTISYGVGLYDDRTSFSEMLSLFHGHDERVSVESVKRTTALYERVVGHFSGT